MSKRRRIGVASSYAYTQTGYEEDGAGANWPGSSLCYNTFEPVDGGSLDITGNAEIEGNLVVGGTISGGTSGSLTFSSIHVTGTSALDGAVTCGSSLHTVGTSALDGTITCGSTSSILVPATCTAMDAKAGAGTVTMLTTAGTVRINPATLQIGSATPTVSSTVAINVNNGNNTTNIDTSNGTGHINLGNAAGPTTTALLGIVNMVSGGGAGPVNIGSSGGPTTVNVSGILNLGTDSGTQTISIGTGTGARAINIGAQNPTASSTTTTMVGTINAGTSGNNNFITIGHSTAGTLGGSTTAVNGVLNFSTGSAQDTMIIGNTTGPTALSVHGVQNYGTDNGTSTISIGTGGVRDIDIGNNSGATVSITAGVQLNLTASGVLSNLSFAAAFGDFVIGAPFTTASTSSIMTGTNANVAAQSSGRVMVQYTIRAHNATAADGWQADLYVQQTTPYVQGAAPTGFNIQRALVHVNPSTVADGDETLTCRFSINSQTIGVLYYYDVAIKSITGGTTTINDVGIQLIEMPV